LFDIDKGLLLKLGEHKEILAAMRGRRKLSKEEIMTYYDSTNPRYEAIEWPKMYSFPEEQGPSYWTLCTFFDSCKVPQILMAIELIDQKKTQKTYKDLCLDMRKSV
jgi:hypothetical protein